MRIGGTIIWLCCVCVQIVRFSAVSAVYLGCVSFLFCVFFCNSCAFL